MNTILFGFKGSGKTHFGRLLAAALGVSFIDTDAILSQWCEHSPKALYQMLGKEGFRLLEKKAVLTLTGVHNTVIAVGGGTILDPENLELLQKIGKLLYLEASLETIKKRGVTLLEGPVEELYRARQPLYRALSRIHVNVDGEEEAVLAMLKEEALRGC